MKRWAGRTVRFVLRGAIAAVIVCCLVVHFQDYLVVPLAFSASRTLEERNPNSLPNGITSEFIDTRDGVRIEVWSSRELPNQKGVALFFAGNGEPIEAVAGLSRWFAEFGLQSFFLSYRGTGRSAGAVSEEGFYADADALWSYAVTRKGLSPRRAFLFSHSLGSGPAAYLAQTRDPAALVLISPFSSLRQVVREMPLYSALVPFLRWNFPVSERIAALPSTCVVVAHGVKDNVVPISHARQISSEYHGARPLKLIEVPEGSHNDLFSGAVLNSIAHGLIECVVSDSISERRIPA